jgi:hypothetical protein
MEHTELVESVIWMVSMGIVTGLLSKFIVEILWRKYMRSWENELKGKICYEKERISAIIRAMKKINLPAPDWNEDRIKNLLYSLLRVLGIADLQNSYFHRPILKKPVDYILTQKISLSHFVNSNS